MNDKSSKSLYPLNDVILIGVQDNTEVDFESLNQPKPSQQQQQQVIDLYGRKGEIHQVATEFLLGEQTYPSVTIPESQLQKQFEEIRFTQCNLMDLDLQQRQQAKSVLELTPYEYEKFIYGRVIEIQSPQLITEGYIMSYKLYQIKTRVIEKDQDDGNSKGTPAFSSEFHLPEKKTSSLIQKRSTSIKKQQPLISKQKQYDTCVSRRFSDFQYLNELLIAKYGGFIIPLLPEKNFWTIVNLQGREYAQTRTKSLVKYLTRLITHKTLKHSQELKNFLFQQDSKFSTQKGEYLQKNKRIQDKIVSISSGALEYGKALYSRFLGGTGDKNKSEEEIRLSKNKLTKDDLVFSEYEIVVGELMRIMADLKDLVENTIQEIQTIEDIHVLFSSGLTDSFNIPTSKPTQERQSSSPKKPSFSSPSSSIPTPQLSQQFQQISQFISSCHAAIHRRKTLRQEIQQLKLQEQNLQEKYKNSPRSLQLDLIRSKLSKLSRMNETYADELLKELEFHIDEGKGMLRVFVVKFQGFRKQFFAQRK